VQGNVEAGRIGRHFGLDWLRIGAFAILILYHIGLYFAPGHWLVKSAEIEPWVAYPIAAIAPWRLMIIFAVSGFASAAMLQRFPSVGAFFRERSRRLLIPLIFGSLVLVPPQGWVRMEVAGHHQTMLHFLTHEEFAFHRIADQFFPNWEHLWFLGYLWVYTGLLAAALILLPDWKARLTPFVAWLCRGWRLLYLPLLLLLGGRLALIALHLDDASRYSDLVGDIHYIPAFLLGFALAHFADFWTAVRRIWPVALGVSAACLAVILSGVAAPVSDPSRAMLILQIAVDTGMAWVMLPVALHLADVVFNRDHPWRQTLALAIFPAYVIHQTVIVLAGWKMREAGIVGLSAFALQVVLVLVSCWAAWALARAVPLFGELLGMPHKRLAASPQKAIRPA
jgi:peptidoglycan/LPS O-acetylase OafA/YrhL